VPNPKYLQHHHAYFQGILRELEVDCQKRPAWVFLCCSAMLEYLAKMSLVPGHQLRGDWEPYVYFVEEFMPDIYKNFKYLSAHQSITQGSTVGTQIRNDLPIQMYCILRCGLVHSFSMTPNSKHISTFSGRHARQRSIVLSHKKRRTSTEPIHLSNYRGVDGSLDAAHFVLQDFITDIQSGIEMLFLRAQNDTVLRQAIKANLEAQPPLVLV
jgi:hypothetical protein